MNQLTAVTCKTGSNVVTKSVQYQYDALGRRIGKAVDDNGNGTMERRETYIYDGAGLLADADGSIHISGPNGATGQAGWTDQMLFVFKDPDADGSSPSQLASRYLYGPAVDQIFASEGASGELLWALTDHLGTPRDWVQRSAAGNTTIAQHTRYTSFAAIDSVVDATGGALAASNSPLASFTGQLYDADTGLMYYRARWYDPKLGKFFPLSDANKALGVVPVGQGKLYNDITNNCITYVKEVLSAGGVDVSKLPGAVDGGFWDVLSQLF